MYHQATPLPPIIRLSFVELRPSEPYDQMYHFRFPSNVDIIMSYELLNCNEFERAGILLNGNLISAIHGGRQLKIDPFIKGMIDEEYHRITYFEVVCSKSHPDITLRIQIGTFEERPDPSTKIIQTCYKYQYHRADPVDGVASIDLRKMYHPEKYIDSINILSPLDDQRYTIPFCGGEHKELRIRARSPIFYEIVYKFQLWYLNGHCVPTVYKKINQYMVADPGDP